MRGDVRLVPLAPLGTTARSPVPSWAWMSFWFGVGFSGESGFADLAPDRASLISSPWLLPFSLGESACGFTEVLSDSVGVLLRAAIRGVPGPLGDAEPDCSFSVALSVLVLAELLGADGSGVSISG